MLLQPLRRVKPDPDDRLISMIGNRIIFREARWLGFFSVIVVGWLLLMLTSAGEVAPVVGSAWPRVLADICTIAAHDTGFLKLYLMWVLMAAAMMAPSFFPALKTYDDLTYAGAGSLSGFAALLAGYLSVWLLYALLAAYLQLRLSGYLRSSDTGGAVSAGMQGCLLLGAGLYQFSNIKEACLSQCRAPLTFYMQHWRTGVTGAFHMGVHLGVVCAGCCWALMALGLLGGAMSLVWMGIATVLMTLEKLPQVGRYLTRALGYTLIFAATVPFGRAVSLFI